jgi:predicted amidophosphoribosyltransferase
MFMDSSRTRHECPKCGLSIDWDGLCPGCAKAIKDAETFEVCIVCKAPFPVGKPHKKCMRAVNPNPSAGVTQPKSKSQVRRHKAQRSK